MTNTQLELIISEETAKKMVAKLDENYLVKSSAVKLLCKRKLLDLKMEVSENPTDFYNNFEKLVNELKNAGENVTKEDKLNYFLLTLPESMSHMVYIVDALAEKDKTVEFVKSKLEFEFKKRHGESENSRSNEFTFEKRREDKRTCYVCGSVGHIQYDCPKKNNSWNQGTPQRGGGRGSRAPQRGGGNGRVYNTQQRGTSSNRRGRNGYRQRGRGARGSDDNSQGHQSAEKSEVLNTSVETRSANIRNGNVNETKIEWILDSGCTDHVINNENYFSDAIVLKEPINVKVGDGRILKATKVGHVKGKFKTYNQKINIKLQNVFYVKDMDRNLISFPKVTDNHKVISIGNSSKIYNRNNKLIAIAWKIGRMYKMTSFIERNKESNLTVKNEKMTLKEKWHRTLGHVNFNYLNTMCKNHVLQGLPNEIETDYYKCATCIENKMHNIPFDNNRNRAKDILEIVHTDLNGPHNTVCYRGKKYFITFIDDYSKLAKIYAIKSRDEVYDRFIEYINLIENKTGKRKLIN